MCFGVLYSRPMSEPLVHVLIINWNGAAHLEACFESLLASTYPHCQFVLVDNASTDGSVEFVRARFGADPRVSVLECGGNLGWSGGNNVGLRAALAAGADYVLLLNNDTWTAPGAIAALVARAEADESIGALAPKLVLFDAPDVINSVGLCCSKIGAAWDLGIGQPDGPAWDDDGEVIGICGAGMFLRAAAVEQTGLLPEDFGIYLDDLDLCLRIWNADYRIAACPEAVIRHKFSATWGQDARAREKYFLNTRNRFYLMLRLFPVFGLPETLFWVAVGEAKALGRAALDGAWWRVRAHLRAWGSAVAYVPRGLAARRAHREAGLGACRFWHLIRRDRLFAEAVTLPTAGNPIETDQGKG